MGPNAKKQIATMAGLLTLSLWVGGCTGTGPAPCSAGAENRGEFCYQGINFGKADDPLYRRGIKDGCSTAKGYFRKDYRLSPRSQSYRQGWDRGRALCRPAGWSDAPTYSYHPLPSGASSSATRDSRRYLSTEERIRLYAQEESAQPASQQTPSNAAEGPEVIRYR